MIGRKVEIMEIILRALLIICIVGAMAMNEHNACNRMPPPGYQTDANAVIRDRINGMSKQQVYSKMNKGLYDIKKK